MKRKHLAVLLILFLGLLFFFGYILKDNLNDFISKKMQESVGTEVVLSGEQWVDSLFNYAKNGEDFKYTLLQFRSTGCTVCKQMEPELEKIKNISSPKINVMVLNVMNANSQNVMKYIGISAVPTHLILDKQGKEIFRKYGFIPAGQLLEKMP